MNIQNIDPNMLADSNISCEMDWADARDRERMSLFGLYKPYEIERYCRMDPAVAATVSPSVEHANYYTAGGRICFVTDARKIALHAILGKASVMFNMPWSGSACFSLYVDDVFCGVFRQKPGEKQTLYELPAGAGIQLPEGDKHVTVYFPCYASVDSVEIGVNHGAYMKPDCPFVAQKPILYYGSSITQGGCCSHAGLTYQDFICRKNGVDYINLGFSGSAKGEPEMAAYLGGLPCSVFVCDFDHNCVTAEELKAVHEPLYKQFRQQQPDTPIIFISRPDFDQRQDENERCRAVIIETFERARGAGDQNVYFLDGETIFGEEMRDACTVDMTHPNDLGFYRFYQALYPFIKRILG